VTDTAASDELVAVAKIVKPRGLKGEAVADVLSDFPDRFESLEFVTAVLPEGRNRELKIEQFRFQQDRLILKFEGVDTVEQAEELRNAEICVFESEAVELEEGEYYDWQLSGCRVETIEGTAIGTVKEVMRTGGTEILAVEGSEREFLVPFAEAICVEVDTHNKLIRIDPPEGLLDF
jgi:16S rRNA processing protein RimM